MRVIIILLILLVNTVMIAQNPGGVKGYMRWSGVDNIEAETDVDINHNKVAKFNMECKTNVFATQKSRLSGLTFFCVSMTDSINERALWSIDTDTATNVLMTNRRMANLEDYKYINFNTPATVVPQISTYSCKQADIDSLSENIYIRLGSKSLNNVPAFDFEGVIPEYVVYNRVLSYNERLRVESYLALKYGVSLSQVSPTSYLNSNGDVIWDAEMYSSYSGSIAGIGRDDMSGLNHNLSGSMETPGLLEIGCSKLDDMNFMVWGDNKASITFNDKRGETKKLQRQWVVAVTGDFVGLKSTLSFSALQIEEIYPLEDNEIYWLAIDDSGSGTFPIGGSRYYPNKSGDNSVLSFEDIVWDSDKSGYDLFTIVAAPELFITTNTKLPSCKNTQAGIITAEIVGGTSPFNVSLILDGEVISKQNSEGNTYTFSELEQGTYTITVADAYNKAYAEEFLLSNSDMEQVVKFDTQTLEQGSKLTVDASQGLSSAVNYSYKWKSQSGEEIYNPELTINEAGIYLLTVSNSEGCCTQRELEVIEESSDYFSEILFYPNPTTLGYVNMRVQLKQRGTLGVTISNTLGYVISNKQVSGSDFYSFTCKLPYKGTWIITLDGGGGRKSLKVLSN